MRRNSSPQDAGTTHSFYGLFQLNVTCIAQNRDPVGTGEFKMTDVALPGSIEPALKKGPDLDRGFHPLTGVIYAGIVAAALLVAL